MSTATSGSRRLLTGRLWRMQGVVFHEMEAGGSCQAGEALFCL